MFSKTTKQMLRNVIRHTGTHNRMVEESEMWKQFESSKDRNDQSARKSFLYDQRSDDYDDKPRRSERSAHMDSDGDTRKEKSTYWTQQLQKFEEADPDRWGHSGYKELYPDDFNPNQPGQRGKHRGERHHDSGRNRIHKKKKKEKKHKKKKKKDRKQRERNESDSESESDSRSRRHRLKNHKSRAKHRKDSDIDSAENYDEERQRKSANRKHRIENTTDTDSSESSDQDRHRKTEKRKHTKENTSNSETESSDYEPRHRKMKKRKRQNSLMENGESKKKKHKR